MYSKQKSDALQMKLYFQCKMYCKGCSAILHTEYVDRDNDQLKVIYKAGKHNYDGSNQKRYSSESGLGRGRKRKYARDIDDEDSEMENEDVEGEDHGKIMMKRVMMKGAMMEKRVMKKKRKMTKKMMQNKKTKKKNMTKKMIMVVKQWRKRCLDTSMLWE